MKAQPAIVACVSPMADHSAKSALAPQRGGRGRNDEEDRPHAPAHVRDALEALERR
jgi:hypothetical protein